jgi:hypothetical protein
MRQSLIPPIAWRKAQALERRPIRLLRSMSSS